MKIYRKLHGKNIVFGCDEIEIELTNDELREAYREYQHILDREDVLSIVDYHADDAEFKEAYGITPEKLEEIADKCAVRYRRYEDENNCWFDNAIDAIREVVIELGLAE